MNETQITTAIQAQQYHKIVAALYPVCKLVIKYVKNNSGNKADGEDIFQESLLILYQNINSGNYKPNTTIQAYVLGIARNCWMQELRRRGKLPQQSLAGLDVLEPDWKDEEGAFFLARQAFLALGQKCQELLTLFYVQQKGLNAIASLLGFASGNVAKNQKYRCLEKAKEHYINLNKKA